MTTSTFQVDFGCVCDSNATNSVTRVFVDKWYCMFKVAFTQRRIKRRKMVVCMLKKILFDGEMDNPSVYYTA